MRQRYRKDAARIDFLLTGQILYPVPYFVPATQTNPYPAGSANSRAALKRQNRRGRRFHLHDSVSDPEKNSRQIFSSRKNINR
jgi:hypothetical protein